MWWFKTGRNILKLWLIIAGAFLLPAIKQNFISAVLYTKFILWQKRQLNSSTHYA